MSQKHASCVRKVSTADPSIADEREATARLKPRDLSHSVSYYIAITVLLIQHIYYDFISRSRQSIPAYQSHPPNHTEAKYRPKTSLGKSHLTPSCPGARAAPSHRPAPLLRLPLLQDQKHTSGTISVRTEFPQLRRMKRCEMGSSIPPCPSHGPCAEGPRRTRGSVHNPTKVVHNLRSMGKGCESVGKEWENHILHYRTVAQVVIAVGLQPGDTPTAKSPNVDE